MKIAVVYYSFDGSCALTASYLQERLNADTFRIKLKNEKKRAGFLKYLWGGGMVLFNKKPELKPLNFDPASYDLIILGAPVWAGSLAPPVISFFSDVKISRKKLAFYVCFGGDKGRAVDQLRALLPDNDIIGELGLKTRPPVSSEELKQQIDAWVREWGIIHS